jgi:hypothetical protein
MKSICVFCGSNTGDDRVFIDATRDFAGTAVRRGLHIVYGGGSVGLMGVLADEVLEAGGRITGVIPRTLQVREVGHGRLTHLHVVKTMHERKALMAALSDGFVALPGGIGTLEEFCEIVTWAQLGVHAKPCGLLNMAGYFDPLLSFFDEMVARRFMQPETRRLMLVEESAARLLDAFATHVPAPVSQWLDSTGT